MTFTEFASPLLYTVPMRRTAGSRRTIAPTMSSTGVSDPTPVMCGRWSVKERPAPAAMGSVT